jgi:hypothetical protein
LPNTILGFWNSLSPRGKRILTIALVFVAVTIITGLAMLTPMTHSQAVDTDNQLNQTLQSAEGAGEGYVFIVAIYAHNLFITILEFIPFFGPVVGFISFYYTGVGMESQAIAMGYSPSLVFVSYLLDPIFWLEYISYSMAIAASIWLSVRILQGNGRHEIVNTAKFIALCAVILLVSAAIETVLIYAIK